MTKKIILLTTFFLVWLSLSGCDSLTIQQASVNGSDYNNIQLIKNSPAETNNPVINAANINKAPDTNPIRDKEETPSDSNNSLIKICPEAWYENKMPTILNDSQESQPTSQYFIINGKRVETSQVDIGWVVANCAVKKPSKIY